MQHCKSAVCSVAQLCLTLCDPMDCNPAGSSVHGILQARMLECVAISSPEDLPKPWVEPVSPEQAGGFFTTEPPGKPYRTHIKYNNICLKHVQFIQFSSVTQLCPTLCDPMNCTTPGFRVHHQLPEFTQTHVHCVSDAIQPSHPLSSPSSPSFNLSQHQGLFQ